MKAIITVTGKDHKGIVASVSAKLSEVEVTLMEEYFTMILLCDFSESPHSIPEVQQQMKEVEEREQLVIRIQSEDIFNAMHSL